jgi:hypothetical protein
VCEAKTSWDWIIIRRTGLGCTRSSSMPSGRVSPCLVNQKAGRQASQERRTNPYCGSWYLAGQKTASSHGAQSSDRRSDQDQSKQESRVPSGQGVEANGLTVTIWVKAAANLVAAVRQPSRSAFSWRGAPWHPSQCLAAEGATECVQLRYDPAGLARARRGSYSGGARFRVCALLLLVGAL